MSNTKKDNKLLVIRIDDRERRLAILDAFKNYAEKNRINIQIIRERLGEGDYLCGDILIELKMLADFKASIYDGRSDTQLQKMLDSSYKCHLVIVGNHLTEMDGRYRNKLLIDESTRKALITKMAKYDTCGIPAKQVFNEEEFAYYCMKLWSYTYIKKPKYKIVRNVLKNEEISVKILMGIPNMGQETASALVKAFPNGIAHICQLTVEEIMTVTAPKSTTPSQKKKNRAKAETIYRSLRNIPIEQELE